MEGPTAAIVLIGNELLSGKIRDANAVYAIGRLRELGVQLKRLAVVPDEAEPIRTELRFAAERFDHVFTSGGIGPTHDDITLECVAAAFGVPLRRNRELETILREHFRERLNEDHLRMAEVPEGTGLIHGGEMRWPVLHFRNIYILPGIPEIFRAKFDAIAERFRAGGFWLRSVYLNADEGTIARHLRDLEARFPVRVGSYPRLDATDHRIRVTIEARDAAPVDAATDHLVAILEPTWIVRVDPVLVATPPATE